MGIYLSIASITAIFSELSVRAKNKTIKKLCILVTIILPSFFYAVRYGIGTDYFNYAAAFDRLQSTAFEGRFEWAYVSLNLIVGHLGGNLEVLFFITAIIMISFLYFALCEYSNMISVGFAMFTYMLLFYQMSFNMVRQSVAMIICLYSIKFIQRRQLLKFTLIIILALGFHNSVLVFIPVYFLYMYLGKEKNQISRLSIYILTIVGVLSIDKVLTKILKAIPQLSYYLVHLQNETGEFTFNYLIRHAPFIILGLLLYKCIKRRDERYIFLFSIYIISLLLKLSGLVGAQYINRISLNFEIVIVLLVAYYVNYFNKTKQIFASIAIVVYLLIYWYYMYILTLSHGTFPYQSIFGI